MQMAAAWIELEIIIPSEVSQTDKYHMIPLICEISSFTKQKFIYKTETDSQT